MRIGILSDSHDHVWNLRRALDLLSREAEVLIHCGDFCSPFIVPILATFPGDVLCVFGNNDADRYRLQMNAARTDNVQLRGEYFEETFGGRTFAVHHFDDVAAPVAESGRFDVVCFGHNHRREMMRTGNTWKVNPGSILGYQPAGAEDVDPSCVVYDTEPGTPHAWVIRNGIPLRTDPEGV